MYKLWEALKEARKYRWVELSHSLNNQSPYWAGIPEGAVELGTTCFDWGNEMLDCLIQTFKFPGQFGTGALCQGPGAVGALWREGSDLSAVCD